MMKLNVCNLRQFFEVVNGCEAPVQLIAPDKETKELRNNDFIQSLLIDMQKGITTLSIQTGSEGDTMKMIRFMMEDGKDMSACRNASAITAA
jgi:hypothetical protein